MAIAPQLLDILVCPEDKGPLVYFESDELLFNPRLHRTYPVRDNIPVMLVDEATTLSEADSAALAVRAESEGARTTGEG